MNRRKKIALVDIKIYFRKRIKYDLFLNITTLFE